MDAGCLHPQPRTSLGSGGLRGRLGAPALHALSKFSPRREGQVAKVSTQTHLESAAVNIHPFPSPQTWWWTQWLKACFTVMPSYASSYCLTLISALKVVLSRTFCNHHLSSSVCSPSSWTSVFSVFPTICFGFQVTLVSVVKRVAFSGCGGSLFPRERVASLAGELCEDSSWDETGCLQRLGTWVGIWAQCG